MNVLSLTICLLSALQNFLAAPVIRDANVSLLIKRNQEVIAEYRSNCPTPQASTMKLVTTATALQKYGPGYRFPTRLEIDGYLDADGKVHGNLYIHGSGDPSLGSKSAYLGDTEVVRKWADTLVARGIRSIEGSVIGDATWESPSACINPKWLWEDVTDGYATGSYGLCYHDNPVVKHSYLFQIEAPCPPLIIAEELTKRLKARGVKVEKAATCLLNPQQSLQVRVPVYIHQSDSLAEIIKHCNRRSDNMYAEQLFLLNGKQGSKPATIADAIQAERAYWTGKIPSLKHDIILDGSGLSAQDGLCAQTLVSLLQYMKTSPYYPQFHASLAVSGTFGTFSSFLQHTALQGKVFGKSGTTSRVKAYAGYVEQRDSQYTFAIIVNDQGGTTSEAKHEIEKLLLALCK